MSWESYIGSLAHLETPEQAAERERREAEERRRNTIEALFRERAGCEHRVSEAEELRKHARARVEKGPT